MDNKIESKTKLQKIIYFLSLFLDNDIGFKAHYYGPYSPIVEQGLGELIGAGFLRQSITHLGYDINHGFEVKRFDYHLTESGSRFAGSLMKDYKDENDKIKSFVEKLKKIGDPDYISLSIAAKAYFILKKENEPIHTSEISNKAGQFGWKIQSTDINNAVEILEQLNLVKKTT